jgi:aminobenzoyl-glutamate transport protein
MKRKLPLIPLLLIASVGVGLVSWVANLYGVDQVQSLLSAEGIRHEVRAALSQYMACPELGIFLMLVPGIGLAWGSGWLSALKRLAPDNLRGGHPALTRRERRSLNWAFSVLGLYAVLIALATVSPWACLRGVTGGLYPSPFVQGLPFVLSVGLALAGWIYGYAAGCFRCYADVRRAFSLPLRRWAAYPVALFFVVRLFAQLAYSRLPQAAGIPQSVMVWAFHLVAVLLFLYYSMTREAR